MLTLKNKTLWMSAFACLLFTTSYAFASGGSSCSLNQNSGGEVIARLSNLTRPVGISPETIYFSAQESFDPACIDFSGGNDLTACQTGQYFGYHFDFDDPDSGVFATTGNSKNTQVSGSPRAAHTFVCDGPDNSRWNEVSQQCEFAVKVRVQNPAGEWGDECVDVSIRSQALEYAPDETYCISSDSNFSECPVRVPPSNLLTDSPPQTIENDLSHSRILYQRGSTGMYGRLCIGYNERNIRVDAYGTGSDPLIEELVVGTVQGCNDRIPTSEQAKSYDVLSKDSNGFITQGWAYGHGAANLRFRDVSVGMSASLLTLHNLDLDWSQGGTFSAQSNGYVSLNSSGFYCYNNEDLDCHLVPYPYGLFVSEVRSVGDVGSGGVIGNVPNVNVGCFNNCGLINSAVIGSYGKTSYEQNLRIMGAWGLVVSNSHYAGNHAGENGPKSKITIRQIETDAEASEVANPENFINGNHAGDGPGWQRSSNFSEHFYNHYNFLIDNILGDTNNTMTNDAAWLELRAGHQYSSVFGTQFLFWPEAEFNATQFAIGGRNITTHDTVFNGANITCRYNTRAWPQPSYQFDESTIFSDTPDGRCNGAIRQLPVPSAPGTHDTDIIFQNGFEPQVEK